MCPTDLRWKTCIFMSTARLGSCGIQRRCRRRLGTKPADAAANHHWRNSGTPRAANAAEPFEALIELEIQRRLAPAGDRRVGIRRRRSASVAR